MIRLLLLTFVTLFASEAINSFKERPLNKRHVSNNPIKSNGIEAAAELIEHSQIFHKGIVEVQPGISPAVYVAVGYGLANMIMIEGNIA